MSLRAQARNRLLLLGLGFLILVGMGGSLFAYREMQAQRATAARRRNGLAEAAAGKNEQAIIDLRVYLNRYPADMEALAAYAKVRPKVPDAGGQYLRDTEGVLRHLLELDANRPDDWRELMHLDYQFNKSTESLDAADQLLTLKPGDTEALEVETGSLLKLHRYQETIDKADLLLAIAPQDWMAQLNRLVALDKTNQTGEIRKTADRLAEKYPDDQGSLLAQGIAMELVNDLTDAKAKLQVAATRPCTDRGVAINVVQELERLGDYADSETALKNFAATGDAEAKRALLRRRWEQGRFADVIALFAAATTQPATVPSVASADTAAGADDAVTDSESLGIYADALHRSKKDTEFNSVIDKLSSRKSDPLAGAWVLINTMTASPTAQQTTALRDACQGAAQVNPHDAYLLYYEGAADAALGETGSAVTLWAQAAQFNLTWANPLVVRSQLELNEGRIEQAARDAQAALRRAPNENIIAVTLAMIGYAQIEAGDNDPAKVQHLKKLIALIQSPEHEAGEETTLRINIALLARDGDSVEATADAKKLLDRQPPPKAQTLLGLASISRQFKLGVEDQCLKILTDTYGQSAEATLSMALNDYMQHKPQDGLQLLQTAAKAANADEAPSYNVMLATYQEFIQDSGATAAWVKVGDAYPTNLNVQRAVIQSSAAYADRAFYDRTINRIRDLQGADSSMWKIARARWMLDGSNDAKTAADATTLLQEVAQREPDSVGADVLLGIAKVRQGDLAGATSQLQAAQRQNPQSAAIDLDVARLMQYRGDFTQARQQLEEASRQQTSPEQRAETGKLLAAQGDMTGARDIFEELAADPQSTDAIKLTLASIYCHTQQFDKAQAIIDALMKNPNPAVIIMAAQIQMFQRHPDKADAILARLASVDPKGDEVMQYTADFRYSFGQLDAATQLYRLATQQAPADPVHWLSLMDAQCLQGKADDAMATADAALKAVPKTAATENHLNQIILVENQKDLMLKIPDGPTQRRLLSGIVKDPSPTGPAVTTLQTMSNLSQSNLSADDVLDGLRKLSNDLPRFLPAQMALTDAQLRLGRCSDAIDSASHAVQAFPTESQPAELAVKAFLQMERWSDALQMAQTWHDRLVGDPLAADLKIAQMELQFGDAAKCLATLQPHKDAPYATDLEKWETVGTEAQALVAQGKADEAVSTLWPDAQLTLSNQADWMKFVVASLPSDAAETWLNKIGDWLKTKPQFAASQIKLASTWDLLAEKSGDKRYAKTGRDLVHQLESDPQLAPEATCTEGEFDEEDRDFKGAQAAYRKAISLAQVSPLGHLTDAENNLAMLLAMHGGDLKEAVAVARQCVTDDPQATYYDTLATVLDKNHDYPGAAQAMQTALQLEPNNAKWYVNLAHLMMEQGKRADAKQLIAQLDLMTPGTRSFARLPQYQDELNTLRELLGSGPSTRP